MTESIIFYKKIKITDIIIFGTYKQNTNNKNYNGRMQDLYS